MIEIGELHHLKTLMASDVRRGLTEFAQATRPLLLGVPKILLLITFSFGGGGLYRVVWFISFSVLCMQIYTTIVQSGVINTIVYFCAFDYLCTV